MGSRFRYLGPTTKTWLRVGRSSQTIKKKFGGGGDSGLPPTEFCYCVAQPRDFMRDFIAIF